MPDPWPEARVTKIKKIIRSIQKASKKSLVSWNTRKPEKFSSLGPYSLRTKYLALCFIAHDLDVDDQHDEFKSYDAIVL